jgi:hypothetical protein
MLPYCYPFGKRYIISYPIFTLGYYTWFENADVGKDDFSYLLFIICWQVRGQGRYCLTLIFEAKNLKLSDFEDRQVRYVVSI